MSERKLQFIEGTSSKFWHAKVDGVNVVVTFGRIGTNGQTQEKAFSSADEAKKQFDKQVAEKLKKGYVDDGEAPTATASASAPASTPNVEAKPAAKKKPAAAAAVEHPAPVEREPEASPSADEAMPAPTTSIASAPAGGPFVRPPVRIRVNDTDRARALVGGLARPQVLPERETWDAERCIARLNKLGKPTDYQYRADWDRAAIDLSLSEHEAKIYWAFIAKHTPISAAIDWARRGNIPDVPAPGVSSNVYAYSGAVATIVFCGFGIEGLVALLQQAQLRPDVRSAVETDIVPFLDEAQRKTMRDALHAQAAALSNPPWLTRLLVHLGEPVDFARNEIAKWASGSMGANAVGSNYGHSANDALTTLFVLGVADEIAREATRLGANPATAPEARAFIAAAGVKAIDLVAKSAIAAGSKADAESIAKAMSLVEAPEAAMPMLDVMLESKAPGVAREWLDAHPAFGAEGLIALALTQGARGEAAMTYLRGLAKRGLTGEIDAALETLPEAARAAAREKIFAAVDAELPIATDAELPEWAERCFGDPTKLTVPDVEVSAEELAAKPRVELSDTDRANIVAPPLPAYEPLAPAAPFDFEACLAKVLAASTTQTYGTQSYHYWNYNTLVPTLPLTRDEALFWNAVYVTASYGVDAATVEKELRKRTYDGSARIQHRQNMMLVATCYALEGFAGLAVTNGENAWGAPQYVDAVIQRVVRHLSPEQRNEFRDHLLARRDPSVAALLLARRLGAPKDALAAAVRRLTSVGGTRQSPAFELLFVFEDPAEIVREAERLGIAPWDPKTAKQWIAATGTLGTRALSESILHSYGDKPGMLKALALVAAPEVAPAMLALRKSSSLKETVRQWLEGHPVFVIDGLLPLVGTKDKLAPAAVDMLRELRRRGYGHVIAARSKGNDAVQKQVLDPKAGLAKPVDADRAMAPLLPQITIATKNGARRLDPTHVATILAELRVSTLGAPTPRLLLVREHADRHSLDAFVWALFQQWLADGAPSKEKWKLEALGHLGHDASALKLAALVRQWPGESQHQRAVAGLECLRAIGTDTALMQIHGISQKVSFKGIKERAGECLDGIAADRGFSRDELADRIIPDGGLDERGSRVFDFGPRAFTFLLGTDLKPMVRDATGKKTTDLPKPGAKDDATKSAAAVADWKVLKKQVADVAKTQATRLELAMVVGRRWTVEEFESLFVKHPLMIHLVRRLIWSAYGADGKPLGTFRVGDDNTYSDSKDAACDLPDGTAHIGVVHASHLSEADRAAWGEVISDYEIIPPFVQLGRPTFPLTDDEKRASLVKRFTGHDVDAKVLVFGLEALGWTRGAPQDGGGFAAHHKSFGSHTAVVTYADGCWVGTNGDDWSRQKIEGIGFVGEGGREVDGFFGWSHDGSNSVKLSDIDAVIVSEAIHDVQRLYERGKPA